MRKTNPDNEIHYFVQLTYGNNIFLKKKKKM